MELSLNLLQNNVQYFKEDDPLGATIILISLMAVVGLVFIVNLAKNGIGSSGLNRGSRTGAQSFSSFALFRLARYYHLNRKQTKILGEVFKINGVTDLSRVMKDPGLLDRCFKRTYKTISRTAENEEVAQQKITQLFSLRNVLETLQGQEGLIDSTTQLAESTMAILNTSEESYPLEVVSSKGENLVLEYPRSTRSAPLQLEKGTRVTLSVFTQSGPGVSFDTRVIEINTASNGAKLELAHSSQVRYTARRKFRRKDISVQCFYYPVRIEETRFRFKKTQKMIVSSKKNTGVSMNISIGGCAMRASVPGPIGSQLKIEINYPRERGLAVLGQVLRINQSGSTGTVMHIKFLKVPRRTWNVINAVVFDYHDD
jgi:c-di-GMP-binding flagellar brake protein YcgR